MGNSLLLKLFVTILNAMVDPKRWVQLVVFWERPMYNRATRSSAVCEADGDGFRCASDGRF